jgi:hypothetical protein
MILRWGGKKGKGKGAIGYKCGENPECMTPCARFSRQQIEIENVIRRSPPDSGIDSWISIVQF